MQRILRRACFPPDCKVSFTGNVRIREAYFDPESVEYEGVTWMLDDAAKKEFPA